MSRTRITLADLNRMKGVVSIRRLAIACGMNETTLRSRIRRQEPELNPEECKMIVASLAQAGLKLK